MFSFKFCISQNVTQLSSSGHFATLGLFFFAHEAQEPSLCSFVFFFFVSKNWSHLQYVALIVYINIFQIIILENSSSFWLESLKYQALTMYIENVTKTKAHLFAHYCICCSTATKMEGLDWILCTCTILQKLAAWWLALSPHGCSGFLSPSWNLEM